MKQIEVQILQQSYLLTCPPGQEQRLLDAVERVDTAMTRIREAGKVRARERIAVLAALNMAFELADKEAQSLSEAANDEKNSSPSTGTIVNPLSGSDTERLTALSQRLEQALHDDGQLL